MLVMELTETEFHELMLLFMVYAPSCFGQEKLVLKAKQEVVVTNLYDGRMFLPGFLWYMASLCDTTFCSSFFISSGSRPALLELSAVLL